MLTVLIVFVGIITAMFIWFGVGLAVVALAGWRIGAACPTETVALAAFVWPIVAVLIVADLACVAFNALRRLFVGE